jgi:hypothetical protein
MDDLRNRAAWAADLGQLVARIASLEAAIDRVGESIRQRLDRLEARVDRLERPT